MRIFNERQAGPFLTSLEKRAFGAVKEDDMQKLVKKIIVDVQKNGDKAVIKYTRKFDSVELKKIRVTQREIESAAKKVDADFLNVLSISAKRIRAFHKNQKEKSWQVSEDGITLGQIIRPIERVGVYVPGGKAAYPSTVLMNVIPAQVAGVSEIALCVPNPEGRIDPYVAAAIRFLGVNEVYKIGGAQAVAALAYGTKTIKKVDKIVGPGNIYVAIAKRMVFGQVGIDMIAGPSEILIIADKTANPAFIASDMLGQAEHDEMASSVLVTDSKPLADKVKTELAKQTKKLIRKEIAKRSLKNYGAIIITKNMDSAATLANRIAPEHLEIMTEWPARHVSKIKNAGAIFLGEWTPEPLGDYAAGPNHTLPTGGTARFSSPLGVYDFIKRTSLLNFSKPGFIGLAKTVEIFADVEGLEAHGNTIRERLK